MKIQIYFPLVVLAAITTSVLGEDAKEDAVKLENGDSRDERAVGRMGNPGRFQYGKPGKNSGPPGPTGNQKFSKGPPGPTGNQGLANSGPPGPYGNNRFTKGPPGPQGNQGLTNSGPPGPYGSQRPPYPPQYQHSSGAIGFGGTPNGQGQGPPRFQHGGPKH